LKSRVPNLDALLEELRGRVTAIIVHGKEKDADVGTIPPGQVSGSLSF